MNNLKLTLRSFFKNGNSNLIKIISLGIGLAMGLLLIAKVCFDLSYDGFYTDSDRIFRIKTGYNYNDGGGSQEYDQVSGAIAPGFKQFVPGVEAATRITPFFESDVFFTVDRKKYTGKSVLVDTCFFSVFDRPILYGNPTDILNEPNSVMVSRSFSEKMGGISNVIGMRIFNDAKPNLMLTIKGVYEDFPENGTFHYDLILSITTFPYPQSLENWMGNDRYSGFVKLEKGIDAGSLTDVIRKMQEEKQPIKELEAEGYSLWYYLYPLTKMHTGDPRVRNMNILLSFLAFALIVTALMNYILITISSLVRRIKEMAIYRCYGAKKSNIRNIMFSEASFFLIMSLVVAFALIFVLRNVIENIMEVPLSALILPQTFWILAAVCVAVYFVSWLIPSLLFSDIPVAAAFRNYKESKRNWKLVLLFFQFTATAVLVSLLYVVSQQYNKMINDNAGYDYENLVYCNVEGVPENLVIQAADKLKLSSNVEMVETSETIPLDFSSGNNVRMSLNDKELFNVADQYDASEGFFELMNFKIIEGRAPKNDRDVAVSRSFAEKMKDFVDWEDGIIGKNLCVTEHCHGANDLLTVCGVYEDYRISSIQNEDKRPSVRFCSQSFDNKYLFIKLNRFEANTIKELAEVLKTSMPDKDIEILVYRDQMKRMYSDSQQFRISVLIGVIITLIIAIIGMIGYTNDETNRRKSEIAIRRINGATSIEILKLFVKDLMYVSIPAVIIGNIASYFIADRWLERFSEKVYLSPWIFIIGGVALLLVVVAVSVINCIKIINANPSDSLRCE